MDPETIRARFLALAGRGWQDAVADALNLRVATVSEQLSRPQVPAYLVAHLEWLESHPAHRWPARWAKLADLAKAKAKRDKAA